MPWTEIFLVFALSHLAGDFLLQTDWQASNKRGGLRGGEAGRALVAHVGTYTLAFVPALIWLAGEMGAAALLVGATISLPHLVQDDGRLISAYIRRIKGPGAPDERMVMIAVDQAFHMLALFGAAVLASHL